MNWIRRSGISRNLIAAVLLLAAASALPVHAQFECRQELMAGTWVLHGDLWVLERDAPDPFPPPGPFSVVGIQVYDAQGRASVAHQTNSTSVGIGRPDFVPILDTQVAMNSDCTGTVTQSLRGDLPPEHPFISQFGYEAGQAVFEGELVCADGQRVCRATFTEPAAVLIGIVTLERIDPAPALTAADVANELTSIRANIEALSRRLGIVPQE